MSTYNADLCEAIQWHCEQQQWYGPDSDKGLYPRHSHRPHVDVAPDSLVFGYRGYFDEAGKVRMRAITHDIRRSFEFLPATDEQIRATEQALGFSLSPFLRTLYTNVANGGFGPAGITGAIGGYYYGNDGRYQTIEACGNTDSKIQYVDFSMYDYPQLVELKRNMWPSHFLHLCYWGDGEDSYVDATSGAVYLQTFRMDANDTYTYVFYHQEPSLEMWVEHWLQDQMQHWSEWGEEIEQKKLVL